ncbi:2-C-methyl-D-erythritol 4-phosphate cytidylyltransferase [bacterium]|nr:2-C-methyl-D-erythritol 4-phosphate cytidylyltransferase [bacterium]
MPTVIIVAAGKGKRTGKNIPKAFLKIKGKLLLFYSIEKFKNFSRVIVVLPRGYVKEWREKLKVLYPEIFIEVVCGGEERQDSVWNALLKVEDDNEIVLIHDVARPFVSEKLIMEIVEKTEKYGACIPVMRIPDTMKKIKGEKVEKTLNRDEIFAVQTPQGFKAGIIKRAYRKAKEKDYKGTDDSFLVEKTGIDVWCIEGERLNFKITYPEDITLSEAIVEYLKEKKQK